MMEVVFVWQILDCFGHEKMCSCDYNYSLTQAVLNNYLIHRALNVCSTRTMIFPSILGPKLRALFQEQSLQFQFTIVRYSLTLFAILSYLERCSGFGDGVSLVDLILYLVEVLHSINFLEFFVLTYLLQCEILFGYCRLFLVKLLKISCSSTI